MTVFCLIHSARVVCYIPAMSIGEETTIPRDSVDSERLTAWFSHPRQILPCVAALPHRQHCVSVEPTGSHHESMRTAWDPAEAAHIFCLYKLLASLDLNDRNIVNVTGVVLYCDAVFLVRRPEVTGDIR